MVQNLLFLNPGIFCQTHFFEVGFHNFLIGILLSPLIHAGEKGRVYFSLLKKGIALYPSKYVKYEHLSGEPNLFFSVTFGRFLRSWYAYYNKNLNLNNVPNYFFTSKLHFIYLFFIFFFRPTKSRENCKNGKHKSKLSAPSSVKPKNVR